MTALQLTSLSKNYGSVAAVKAIDLSVPAGSRTAIVGPSGCGKTTLLRLIAGFEAPDAGRITLAGSVVADEEMCVPAHRRGVGVVAQDGCLFPHLSIRDNIGFGLPKRSLDRAARVDKLMDMVGLGRAMAERRPHELSGGQQQRVALARALAPEPRLMLLDEPFSALDTGLRAMTRKVVAEVLASAGITAILVTHDQAEALAFADQVAVMRDGSFAQIGSPLDVYASPRDCMTAQFLGEAIVLPADLMRGEARCALGTLTIMDTALTGRADVLLRPGQIDIRPQSEGALPVSQLAGTIFEIEFCGAHYDVAIQLEATAMATVDPAPILRLSVPTRDILRQGQKVVIAVNGHAHVLQS